MLDFDNDVLAVKTLDLPFEFDSSLDVGSNIVPLFNFFNSKKVAELSIVEDLSLSKENDLESIDVIVGLFLDF